ncbi:MAG: hypothetical protein ACJ79L_00550, partial [Anaeromyxobacteraceae bacterium]
LWTRPDAALAVLAEKDLAALGFGGRRVLEAHVVRMADAYPVYDEGFADRIATVARELAGLPNLALAGRNGMHRYNNMDHAIRSGMLAAENLLGASHDLWAADLDDGYLEPEAVERRTR